MLTVYLCEDHPEELDFFKETILKILEDYSGKILWGGAFSSPEQLLDTRAVAEGCGIYFLDIDLGQSSMNGLTLAQKLRGLDPRCYIAFVTTHSEMSYLTFTHHLEALDFVLKDQFSQIPERFRSCMETALRREEATLSREMLPVTVKIGGGLRTLNLRDLVYVDTAKGDHRIYFHSAAQVSSCHGTLRELENVLTENGFLRCHKSVLVNRRFIQELQENARQLLLSGGLTCPVSVRYLKSVKEALNR